MCLTKVFREENCFLATSFTQAPAVQLAEHAEAILEDDIRIGVQRDDPVLRRLAQGGAKHSVS